MVKDITHYYKRLKLDDKIIFWSGCILFCYPQSHIPGVMLMYERTSKDRKISAYVGKN